MSMWNFPVWAYVDPGFSATFVQFVYVLIFGVLFGWVARPMRFLRSLFQKKKKDEKKTSDQVRKTPRGTG